jgi:hypothetical protein
MVSVYGGGQQIHRAVLIDTRSAVLSVELLVNKDAAKEAQAAFETFLKEHVRVAQ